MSRLTASPFHKPSPFSFPRAPLSPPDTALEANSISVTGQDRIDSEIPATESPAARFRRASSLAYRSAGVDRDRFSRNYKSFIVVIPPATILQEHGQLGHTLSLGPRHRLPQGLLMPLFPTMYAQLNVIAKEFNFPSTVGICLYLQHTDNGITVKPRISDETWAHLWNNVLDAPNPPSSGLPIYGKVEFDIDIRYARWYASWIASVHHTDQQVPSTAPSLTHFREDSRNTLGEEQNDDDVYAPRSAPSARHIPRKLSLLDRLESFSTRSESQPVPRPPVTTPPENIPSTSQTLSPIFQEDEPQTAKLILEKKVQSWRASAKLAPTALAARGQISLEPANMPNSMDIDIASNSDIEAEFNLEDYSWSVSSAGPNDYDPESPLSSDYRLPSVHLADRLEGSVCLTPSVCTSFGPSDYTLSPLSEAEFRPFSPDLAHRMYEDAPLTPTTATSWGPASVYFSPVQSEYTPSIDLGQRAVFSWPATPSTSTSWGPNSWPPSPTMVSRPPSVHLGDRGEYSRPVTPSTAPIPLSYPLPNASHREFDVESPLHSQGPWRHVWPYTSAEKVTSVEPWSHLWSHSSPRIEKLTEDDHPKIITLSYPYLNIYAAIYPYFDLYPAAPLAQMVLRSHARFSYLKSFASIYDRLEQSTKSKETNDTCIPLLQTLPYLDRFANIYARVPVVYIRPSLPHTSCSYLSLFATVYSYFELNSKRIEPTSTGTAFSRHRLPFLKSVERIYAYFTSSTNAVSIQHTIGYPFFNLYPPQYPHFDLYPRLPHARHSDVASFRQITVKLPAQYPNFVLYPAIYPWNLNEIYPHYRIRSNVLDVNSQADYPCFNLYPAVYPHVTPYPSVQIILEDSTLCGLKSQKAIDSVKSAESMSSQYPDFCLYPQSRTLLAEGTITVQAPVFYPDFIIYPAVYPNFELYPVKAQNSHCEPVSLRLSTVYPMFNLYPAVYPAFDLYPVMPQVMPRGEPRSLASKSRSLHTESQYPFFELYRAVYPALTIYPSFPTDVLRSKEVRKWSDPGIHLEAIPASQQRSNFDYPFFSIYPAVYPHFDLYPADPCASGRQSQIKQQSSWIYPFFNFYPAVYPYFDLYPVGISMSTKNGKLTVVNHLAAQYPFFDLYPPVYPFFRLYPSMQPLIQLKRKKRKTHKDLHDLVFQSAYPRNRKSDQELHQSVFPPGIVVAPVSELSTSRSAISRPAISRPRSGTVARPSGQHIPKVIIATSAIPKNDSSPTLQKRGPRLSPITERSAALSRSSSAALPHRLVALEAEKTVDRSQSLSHKPKRDSLVLQRVKAFNSRSDDGDTPVDTLRKVGSKSQSQSKPPFA